MQWHWDVMKFLWKKTDFDQHIIDYDLIEDGGVGKNGIKSIDAPEMIPVDEETRLIDREPVMVVALADETPRAYPLRYLLWHEIVNDRIGDRAIAVTYCPLCNSGVVFDRVVNRDELEFGVSGFLYNADLIMYDRQSESWWQQFTGQALVGSYVGQSLTKIPSWIESWGQFKSAFPDGLVLDNPRMAGYGLNPYPKYEEGRFVPYKGENPPHGIAPTARVIVVGTRAWPLARLVKEGEIKEAGIHLSLAGRTASPLDHRYLQDSRDIAAVRVRDAQGVDLVHDLAFAFAFHAFNPDGQWMLGR